MIREATIDDKPRLVEMATRFIETTSFGKFLRADPERLATLVDQCLELGVIFVEERRQLADLRAGDGAVEDDPKLVGMLAMVGPFPHSADGRGYAEEVAWWVEPEHRGGSIARRLMHQMEGWCGQNSVYMVKMLAPTDSEVGTFYSRLGYQAVEVAWIKVFP